MGFLESIRDVLSPDTEPGVEYECDECGTRFDTALPACPECGSSEIKEVEGFEMRPEG